MKYHDHRDPRIVYLQVSTYGGMHVYGTIRWYTVGQDRSVERLDVECVLGPYATRQMNREDPSYRYTVGDDCSRFLDEVALRFAALDQFRRQFDRETHILVEASPGDLDPCEVIHGPEPWRTEINAIYREFKDGKGWYNDTVDDIAARYETKMMEVIPEKPE